MRLAGVDGCPGGWVAAVDDRGAVSFARFSSFADLLAFDAVAETLGEDDTEVSVLIPQRKYRRFWHRLLHDRTADAIAEALDGMTHVNVTIVPYLLGVDASTGTDRERPIAFQPHAKPRKAAKKKAAKTA